MKKLLLTLLLALALSSCDDVTTDGYYRFKITSTGNKFFGMYTIDAEKDAFISDTDVKQTGNYYIFDKELDSPSTISIKVDGFDFNESLGTAQTTRISIEIYEGDELVVDKYITASTYDQHLYLSLYHEFTGEEDDGDDDESEEEEK